VIPIKIKKKSDSSWYELPVPVVMTPTVNALDSSKSGRDNNTGAMFRDKVAEKQSYSITFPHGLNNTEVSKIVQIVMDDQFDIYAPDPKSGAYSTKSFYASAVTPEIFLIVDESLWYYKEFTIEAVEM
jgi:hypothetical protein